MGIKNCEISLDSPTDTYYAGQILNGNLKITFDKPKTVQALIIRFKGEAQTKWQETVRTRDKDGNMRNKTHTQLGEEEYFKTKVYLVGGSGSEVELAAGTYDFAFSWQIPLTVPSSFEGEHGYIRYSIKVTLDRPLCLDKEMHSPFTVITPVDLNMTPQLYTPATLDMHKSFCCLWCKSGPVTVLVRIPVTGYAPGQAIPISCDCENASDVDVAKVQFTLRRIVTFTTTTPHYSKKTSSSDIAELGVGPVLRFQNKSYEEHLQIPVFPTTNLLYCGLMTMSFVLQVECRVSGCHSNFFNEIPITLGTIPLASFVPAAPAVESPPTYESTQDLNATAPPPSMDVPIGWNFGDAPQLGNEDPDYGPTQALVDEKYRPSSPSFQNPQSAPGLEK